MARQDPELQAIATIGKALDKLKTPEQRRRVIAFVSSRAEPDYSVGLSGATYGYNLLQTNAGQAKIG